MKKKFRFALDVIVWTLLGALVPSPSYAETNANLATALFDEGRELAAKGDYQNACPKFEKSLELQQGSGTKFNLADCWEHLGRTASAWRLYLDVAAAAQAQQQPEREAASRARATALEPKLARVVIQVPASEANVELTFDAGVVAKESWGSPLPIDPGAHEVRASAPGKKPWTTRVEVPAASTVSVAVPALEPGDAAPAAGTGAIAQSTTAPLESSAGAPPAPDSSSASTQRTLAFVLGGVGVAGVAVGTVFAFRLKSKNDDAAEICRSNPNSCPPEDVARHDELVDQAKTARIGTIVGFSVGGAALGAAAVLYFTLPKSPQASEAARYVPSLFVSENTWGGALTGRF